MRQNHWSFFIKLFFAWVLVEDLTVWECVKTSCTWAHTLYTNLFQKICWKLKYLFLKRNIENKFHIIFFCALGTTSLLCLFSFTCCSKDTVWYCVFVLTWVELACFCFLPSWSFIHLHVFSLWYFMLFYDILCYFTVYSTIYFFKWYIHECKNSLTLISHI